MCDDAVVVGIFSNEDVNIHIQKGYTRKRAAASLLAFCREISREGLLLVVVLPSPFSKSTICFGIDVNKNICFDIRNNLYFVRNCGT